MTELQLGLLIIGVLAIAGVMIYNRIQERRARRDAERSFGSSHTDVLMGGVTERAESAPAIEVRKVATDQGFEAELLPDERIDYVLEMLVASPVAASGVLDAWRTLEHRFKRRCLLAGSGEDGTLERIIARPRGSLSRLVAALQLVSRDGVVTESDLIEFRTAVENLAASIGASVAAPEMKNAIEHARNLDRVCAQTDIQIVFHVVAPKDHSFSQQQIESVAIDSGLEAAGSGTYVHSDAEGHKLYAISAKNAEQEQSSDELILSLDVPRIRDVRRSYESMSRCAQHLATALGGTLEDDNGRTLDERALAAIQSELESVGKTLEQIGIQTGGSLALRLFS